MCSLLSSSLLMIFLITYDDFADTLRLFSMLHLPPCSVMSHYPIIRTNLFPDLIAGETALWRSTGTSDTRSSGRRRITRSSSLREQMPHSVVLVEQQLSHHHPVHGHGLAAAGDAQANHPPSAFLR